MSDVPSSQWALDASSGTMKKVCGVARTVAAFKGTRRRSFGVRISETQFADYNTNRVS